MTLKHPEAWEGDGFEEDDDEEVLILLKDLGCLEFEIEALIEANKREAWVREKVAKHEDCEDNLTMARFYWRRTDRLRAILKLMKHNESGEES